MKARTFLLLMLLVVIAVFAIINWSTFTAPTALSLVFGTVQAPLGIVMLGLVAFLIALFVVFAALMRTSALLDSRRHDRELQAVRELAEHAEASRFTKLQELFETEAQRQADADRDSRAEVLARLDKLEETLSSAIGQVENSLSAYIGELDDKVERAARPEPSPSGS